MEGGRTLSGSPPFSFLLSTSTSLAAAEVVVYTGPPGDSRRQTLLFHLFFDPTRNLPPHCFLLLCSASVRTVRIVAMTAERRRRTTPAQSTPLFL